MFDLQPKISLKYHHGGRYWEASGKPGIPTLCGSAKTSVWNVSCLV